MMTSTHRNRCRFANGDHIGFRLKNFHIPSHHWRFMPTKHFYINSQPNNSKAQISINCTVMKNYNQQKLPVQEVAYLLRRFNYERNRHKLPINLYPPTFHCTNLQCTTTDIITTSHRNLILNHKHKSNYKATKTRA